MIEEESIDLNFQSIREFFSSGGGFENGCIVPETVEFRFRFFTKIENPFKFPTLMILGNFLSFLVFEDESRYVNFLCIRARRV